MSVFESQCDELSVTVVLVVVNKDAVYSQSQEVEEVGEMEGGL